MFTLDQIHEAHARVKSGADFPHYIQDLIVLGVQKYDIFVHDGHGEYASSDGDTLVSPPKYDTLTVADTSDVEGFTERLRAHQQGQTDYMTFCQDSANAGVEKWTVDTTAMTCTYYGRSQSGENNTSVPFSEVDEGQSEILRRMKAPLCPSVACGEGGAKEYDKAGEMMLEERISTI